jgi:hypothetical protein
MTVLCANLFCDPRRCRTEAKKKVPIDKKCHRDENDPLASFGPPFGMQSMPRTARIRLVACLVALYGSISLCGSGLHSLMEPSPAHHSHDREHERDSKTIQAVSDHCALCDFQAQGQLPVDSPPLESQRYDQPHLAFVAAVISARDRHTSSSPRAPPASPCTTA